MRGVGGRAPQKVLNSSAHSSIPGRARPPRARPRGPTPGRSRPLRAAGGARWPPWRDLRRNRCVFKPQSELIVKLAKLTRPGPSLALPFPSPSEGRWQFWIASRGPDFKAPVSQYPSPGPPLPRWPARPATASRREPHSPGHALCGYAPAWGAGRARSNPQRRTGFCGAPSQTYYVILTPPFSDCLAHFESTKGTGPHGNLSKKKKKKSVAIPRKYSSMDILMFLSIFFFSWYNNFISWPRF